ncbi:MAG TPA: hypothetical protein DEQ28_08805 [Clostridiales bacterium]|nr:hypothetical protein [Clostridiales bacterium]
MGTPVEALRRASGRGPWSGDPAGCIHLRRVISNTSAAAFAPPGPLVSEADAAALSLLRRFRCMSGAQLGELAGVGVHSVRDLLRRMCRGGLADRLDFLSSRIPSLYVEGPCGRRLMGGPPVVEDWEPLRALRLAASSQLYMLLWRLWGPFPVQIEPGGGLTAIFSAGAPFGVLVARLWPGELDWARDAARLSADIASVLVLVAGSREQAEELGRVVRVSGMEIRLTWDGPLFHGRAEFWRPVSRGLEPVRLASS